MNIINNITTDTTTASINNSVNGIGDNPNLIHLMAKKMIKNSIFSKYLIKNKNKKKIIIKDDLEQKFYTLQKYKDIIGLIENLKNKIFKKKYIDFNYQSFDDYLNDDDDKIFSQYFINKTKINSFLKKAKFSLYQKEKQKRRAYSKANNLNLKFNKINKEHILKERYVTEQKNFEKKPRINLGYYNPKKKLNLSYLISDQNINKKRRTRYRKKSLDKSVNSNDNKSITVSNSYIKKSLDKKYFSSESTKDKNLNINLKVYKFNNKNKNKNESLEYDSDISFTSNNTKIINKTKTNINNSSSIMNDIHENDESFSSNNNYNINITKEENGIYKKNKNITTPQLGTKINNNDNILYNQNSPSKYDADEKEQFIIDNISLMINTKNKKKEISIKDNEQLRKEVWKLSDKKESNEKNSRNIVTSNTGINSTISVNKTNMTFSGKNKSKKYIKIKKDFPIDLNCVINLPFDEIKYRIKLYFKKAGFFSTEKGNVIKVKRGNTNIEIILYKLEGENNFFYLSTKIKSNELKKEKENLRKLIYMLNGSNRV